MASECGSQPKEVRQEKSVSLDQAISSIDEIENSLDNLLTRVTGTERTNKEAASSEIKKERVTLLRLLDDGPGIIRGKVGTIKKAIDLLEEILF